MTKGTLTHVDGDAVRPEGSGEVHRFILHVVNDKGLWGKGFVLALAQRWPKTRVEYRKDYRLFKLGDIQEVLVEEKISVVNMFAQHGVWSPKNSRPLRYGALRYCLGGVRRLMEYAPPGATVHMPRIGCGLARGDWDRVEPIVVDQLVNKGIDVWVYRFIPAYRRKEASRHVPRQEE